jgi:hypothetical protein
VFLPDELDPEEETQESDHAGRHGWSQIQQEPVAEGFFHV